MSAPVAGGAQPAPPGGRPRSWWHSLRGRATLVFAALSVLVTLVVIVGVWLTVSQYLLLQRERVAAAQTAANADRLERGLPAVGISAPRLLSQLPRETGSTSLLLDDGAWYTTSLRVGRDDLPVGLRSRVIGGTAAQQRIAVGGETMLAVGVPLAAGSSDSPSDRAYFEVFPLRELDETYQTLGTVLAAAGIAVPGLALLLGWWVTKPALRPLDRISAAAAAIASGELQTRIDPRGDPTLVPIATSFNRTAAALERRVQADARFAGDVAHELRTPLTAMLGGLSLVELHRERLPEEGREGVDMLREEVDRFHRLVQDLLEISRTDAGNADVAVEEVLIADLVRWSLPEPVRERLVVEPGAEDVAVRADKRRLRQVVVNLVGNADVHGGGVVRVRLARVVDEVGDRVELAVDDAGPGVEPAERERIFERFARGRRSVPTATSGTGLGLSLVARHLHLMHAGIRVEDSPEGGARFVVTLPVVEEE